MDAGALKPQQQVAIAAAESSKKHLLSCAASSFVSGGTSRVFTFPGRGALVIKANAEKPANSLVGFAGLRIRCRCIIRSAGDFYFFSQRAY
jgi:hypothetical protein